MRVKSYQVRRIHDRSHVFGGNLIDLDSEAGLEDILQREIKSGQKIIVLNLKGTRIINENIFFAILRSNQLLSSINGRFYISESQEFIKWIFDQAEVSDKFIFIEDENYLDRILSYSKLLSDTHSSSPLTKLYLKKIESVFG